MPDRDPWELPPDLLDMEERLRSGREDVSPLELDRLKRRAIVQASRRAAVPRRGRRFLPIAPKGRPMKARAAAFILAAAIIGGTATAGLASKVGAGGGSAAQTEYRPGNGCGDKNHTHTGPPGHPGQGPSCPPHHH